MVFMRNKLLSGTPAAWGITYRQPMGNTFFKEYITLSGVRHAKQFQWVKMQTLKDK